MLDSKDNCMTEIANKNKSMSKVPNLRFSGFEGEWEMEKLGEICEINPKNEYLPSSFIYIDLESVVNGRLLKEDCISKEEAPSRAQRVLAKNDVLFQMVRPYQKNNLFFDKKGKYVASTGYAQIRTKQDSQFIFQYLHNQKFVDKVIERCTGTSYPAINSSDLGNILINYPNLDEQKKIAGFLYLIDQKISTQNKIIRELSVLKITIANRIFSQELRFKDNNLNSYSNWVASKLGDVLEIQGGFAFKSNSFNQGNTKVLRIGDIESRIKLNNFSGVYSKEKPSIKYLVKKNDFVMALSGATFGKVGKILDDGNAHINQRVALFKTDYCLEFYYQLVQTDNFKSYINSIPSASAQPNISNNDISNYNLFNPSILEQTKIANFLSSIDSKIDIDVQLLKKLEEQKKYLLQNLFV